MKLQAAGLLFNSQECEIHYLGLMAEGCQKNCIFRWCFLTGIIWLSIYMSVCLLLLQICFLDIQFCKLKKYFKENLNSGVVAEISVVEILWSCMQNVKKKLCLCSILPKLSNGLETCQTSWGKMYLGNNRQNFIILMFFVNANFIQILTQVLKGNQFS